MKVAVLSESPADEAAVRILTDAILRTPTEAIATYTLRTRGWPAVRKALPTVLMHLTYQTEAEGLVVVVDSDGSTIHEPTHGVPGKAPTDCRICQLHGIVDQQRRSLRTVPGRHPVRVAIGLAVPAIEAWYLRGREDAVDERTWPPGASASTIRAGKLELKRQVYGSDRAGLGVMKEHAITEMTRVVTDLDALQAAFPKGFGALLGDFDSW